MVRVTVTVMMSYGTFSMSVFSENDFKERNFRKWERKRKKVWSEREWKKEEKGFRILFSLIHKLNRVFIVLSLSFLLWGSILLMSFRSSRASFLCLSVRVIVFTVNVPVIRMNEHWCLNSNPLSLSLSLSQQNSCPYTYIKTATQFDHWPFWESSDSLSPTKPIRHATLRYIFTLSTIYSPHNFLFSFPFLHFF